MSRFSEEEAKKKCSELNLEYVGFHKKMRLGTMVDFICPKHRDKGVQSSDWSHFQSYTIGCPFCTGRYRTTEEFEQLILGMNIKVQSKYLGNEKPIDLKCEICGYEWTTKPKVQLSNKSGCPKCGRKKANLNEMKSRETLIEEFSVVNPFIEIVGEYYGTHKWIECKCKICNKKFDGMPARLLRGESGCPFCNLSDGERKLLINLDLLQIPYTRQYSIKDCKNINALRFDAFDTVHNVAFKYNGEQHYYPISFSSDVSPENNYEITVKRDQIKREYCKTNNIPLIIVPYWEKNNMYDYMIKEIMNRRLNYITNIN